MTEPKNFLTRWSRRKLVSADKANAAAPVQDAASPSKEAAVKPAASAPPAPPAEFDPATLPSIDSIVANSDIRAFLQRGVPPGLTRAALRRAWSADPAIRDFVGLSENSWDFNAADSMRGFGPLDPEDARRIAAQFFGSPEGDVAGGTCAEPPPPGQSASATGESEGVGLHEVPETDLSAEMAKPKPVQMPQESAHQPRPETSSHPGGTDIAAQHKEEKAKYDVASLPARHGGALPE
jgi:hypothetical protein